MKTRTMTSIFGQFGFSFLELLVSVAVSGIIASGLVVQLRQTVQQARDHQIRLDTFVQAQAITQTIAAEIRMAGNGVPFDQKDFVIASPNLSDPTVTEPFLVSECTETKLTLRLNEAGEVFLLAAPFDPTTSAAITLNDVSQFEAGDPLYISNSTVPSPTCSGDDGFFGEVASVDMSSSTLTLRSGFVYSPGGCFPTGSIVEEVPLIRYTSLDNMITRNAGKGEVLLGSNSTITFDYLDIDGNKITLPLVATQLIDKLRSIRVTVKMQNPRPLSTGENYQATVEEVIGIRNLDYLF